MNLMRPDNLAWGISADKALRWTRRTTAAEEDASQADKTRKAANQMAE